VGHLSWPTWSAASLLPLLVAVIFQVSCGSSKPGAIGGTSAGGDTGLVIDVEPSDNSPSRLGEIQSCRRVTIGETFDVDVAVENVTDLLAWEMEFAYYPSLLEVEARNVDLFSGANEGSNVFDVSEGVPDTDGHYSLAAADIADPTAPDSGSGVLAHLTLKALAAGVSPLAIPPLDLDNDGRADRGPTLTDVDGSKISDDNDDTLFDGNITNAQIAIDQDCPAGPPPAYDEATPLDEFTAH